MYVCDVYTMIFKARSYKIHYMVYGAYHMCELCIYTHRYSYIQVFTYLCIGRREIFKSVECIHVACRTAQLISLKN